MVNLIQQEIYKQIILFSKYNILKIIMSVNFSFDKLFFYVHINLFIQYFFIVQVLKKHDVLNCFYLYYIDDFCLLNFSMDLITFLIDTLYNSLQYHSTNVLNQSLIIISHIILLLLTSYLRVMDSLNKLIYITIDLNYFKKIIKNKYSK